MSSTHLEQSKLCVNSPLYIDTGLLWEQTIGSNSTQSIDNEIVKASMSGVLHLRNILKLIIHGFYNGSFSE